MAMVKWFTDIDPANKLAEILPIESADMHYWLAWSGGVSEEKRNTPKVGVPNKDAIKTYWRPCWSLAALYDVLPEIDNIFPTLEKVKAEDGYEGYYYFIEYKNKIMIPYSKNPVDACYRMVMKLHELELI